MLLRDIGGQRETSQGIAKRCGTLRDFAEQRVTAPYAKGPAASQESRSPAYQGRNKRQDEAKVKAGEIAEGLGGNLSHGLVPVHETDCEEVLNKVPAVLGKSEGQNNQRIPRQSGRLGSKHKPHLATSRPT